MASRLFRVGRGAVATAGGLFTAGVVDRALKPPLKPMSTATAAGAALGSVRLYQYEICPFCNKVKALLDLYKVPYDTVDVNPLTKGEIKPWSGGYKKVPIALLGGGEGTEPEQVNDSPVIAAALLERMSAGGAISKSELERFRSPKALEWAEWSDSKLAVLLFPNITRNFGEAFQAFSYVREVPHFSLLEKASNQLVGSFAMWMAQGKIKKKYAIDDERAAAVGAINHWLQEGVGAQKYAGGERPNFADVCVFGALKAIDRTDAHAELMRETGIKPWYERMAAEVAPGNACTSRQ